MCLIFSGKYEIGENEWKVTIFAHFFSDNCVFSDPEINHQYLVQNAILSFGAFNAVRRYRSHNMAGVTQRLHLR